jgi:glycosyltransferase involved in cell wall biosynthesis
VLHNERNSPPSNAVAMLCQGNEVYGIGTIQKLYGRHMPGVHFFCMTEGALTQWLRDDGCPVDVVPGLPMLAAGKSSSAMLARVPRAFLQARRDARRIHQLIAPRGIRIVHTHWLPQQLIAGHMKHLYGYKAVWQINNNTSRTRLWGLGIKLNHRLARWGADLLLPASDYIADNWRESGVPLRTIRNAAEPFSAEPSILPTTGPVRCVVAGRLEASKGHHLAIDAVLRVRAQGLPVELDVFGGPLEGNAYGDELRKKVADAGASDSIRFLGFRDDLRRQHLTYHLGLQCRIDPEPCSLWVCETLVDGLPLVASASGGTPELVADGVTGLLYRPGDVGDLTDKLTALVRDPNRLATMRVAAFDRGRAMFTTDRFIRETLAAYDLVR